MKEIYEELCTHILPQLISPNSKVLVALSGGPDSMALTHILWRYVQKEKTKNISLVLTHVHHGVRLESDEEEKMIINIAKKWEIPCRIHHFDAKSYAKTMGLSFQEAAREWRYARWKEDMLQEECTLLATAHHLGDQAETILYRLLRGSGTAGLAGIYSSKDSIIRPLLSFKKADILRYCTDEALPYALDQSNEEPVYVRNRIRLELIPELEKKYNPRIQEALGRTGELLRWDEEYFVQQIEGAWNRYSLIGSSGSIGLRREVFSEPKAILSRLLRRAAMELTHEPRGLGYLYVTKIMNSEGEPGWMQDLPGMKAIVTEKEIWFHPLRNNPHSQPIAIPEVDLCMGSWSDIPNLDFRIGLFKDRGIDNPEDDSQEEKMAVFDYSQIVSLQGELVCRTRRQGDKMWVQGVGHKSLKKIFQEEKISIEVRDYLPLVAHGTEVLWIPGVRQSELYSCQKNLNKAAFVLRPFVRVLN